MLKGKYLVLASVTPYAVDHIIYFFYNKLDLESIRNTIEEILKKHSKYVSDCESADWNSLCRDDMAYIGVEVLPFEGEGYAYIMFDRKLQSLKSFSTITAVSVENLKRYRAKRITIDIDNSEDYVAGLAIYKLYKIYGIRISRVVKTERGFHIVGESDDELPLISRLVIREELGDDASRLNYDKILISNGLGYLAEILFDYKWWRGEQNFHKWIDIPLDRIPVAIPVNDIRFPEGFRIQLRKGFAEFATYTWFRNGQQMETYLAVFHGYSVEEAEKILRKVVERVRSIL